MIKNLLLFILGLTARVVWFEKAYYDLNRVLLWYGFQSGFYKKAEDWFL